MKTQVTMTSRERVLKSIHHEEPDRLPIDFGGMASTGIMAIAYARLKEHLGITSGEIRVFDMGQQLAEVEPEVLSRFGVDVISLGALTRNARWIDLSLEIDSEIEQNSNR